jgi:thioredoxin
MKINRYNMKRPFYLFAALLAVSVLSCNGQPEKPIETEKKNSEATQALTMKPTADMTNSGPIHISKADFLKLVMDFEKNPEVWSFQGEKPCLVDFYADWCAPCRITSPIIDELAKTYAGRINFYKVDVDKEKELASVFGVQSIPTFLFCPVEGKPTISSGIASSPEDTKKMFIQQIEELLLKKAGNSSI